MMIVLGRFEIWILLFCVSEVCLFLCSFLMRFFVVQNFSLSRTVCGWLRNLDEFIVVPIINYAGLAIVAEADLLCGNCLYEESCRYKLVVSTSFWSRLLNVSSVLTSLKYTAIFFGVVNALWVC